MYSRAKILLKSDWVWSNVTKFVEARPSTSPTTEKPTTSSTTPVLREAPPILVLEDHEKFRDLENNLYEVEVRGVREEEKIYFRGKDIERVFEMENLVHDVILKTTKYGNKVDYEKFLLSKKENPSASGPVEETTTIKMVKRTYFTYNGLLKVIYRSNAGVGYRFRKWATRVIYVAHLGTDEQRFTQALDMVGVNSALVKKVFDTCVTHPMGLCPIVT